MPHKFHLGTPALLGALDVGDSLQVFDPLTVGDGYGGMAS